MVKFWAVSKKSPLKPISIKESKWAKSLPKEREIIFIHSRGYLRYFLSYIFNTPALDIPLNCPPGKPPRFKDESLGYISISHCNDCTIFAFSNYPIGADVEIINRETSMSKVVNKYGR